MTHLPRTNILGSSWGGGFSIQVGCFSNKLFFWGLRNKFPWRILFLGFRCSVEACKSCWKGHHLSKAFGGGACYSKTRHEFLEGRNFRRTLGRTSHFDFQSFFWENFLIIPKPERIYFLFSYNFPIISNHFDG